MHLLLPTNRNSTLDNQGNPDYQSHSLRHIGYLIVLTPDCRHEIPFHAQNRPLP